MDISRPFWIRPQNARSSLETEYWADGYMHKKDITAIDSKTLESIVLETHDVLLLETFVVGNLRMGR